MTLAFWAFDAIWIVTARYRFYRPIFASKGLVKPQIQIRTLASIRSRLVGLQADQDGSSVADSHADDASNLCRGRTRSFLTGGIRSGRSLIKNTEKGRVSRDYSNTDSISESVLSNAIYMYIRGGVRVCSPSRFIYIYTGEDTVFYSGGGVQI